MEVSNHLMLPIVTISETPQTPSAIRKMDSVNSKKYQKRISPATTNQKFIHILGDNIGKYKQC